jgi:hypothetical protein
MTNANSNNHRKSTLSKNNKNNKSNNNNNNNNNISSNNNTLRSKRILTWERKSIDVKKQKKEKSNISINKNEKIEKFKSNNICLQKNNCKILSSRPNSLVNKQRYSTINNNLNTSINILKKSQDKKKQCHSNKLTLSNPILM